MLIVKWLHLACVLCSILGFVLRLYWRVMGSGMVRRKWVRVSPHIVDTALLLSGAYLVYGTGYTLGAGWLQAKLAALIIYILLGMKAFRWSRNREQTFWYGIAAIFVFTYIAGTAANKNPVWFVGG